MRLLIIGLNYAPEPVGIGPYTAGMAADLATAGHAVRVIAGQPYYPQWRRHSGDRSFRWSHSNEGGVKVLRCPHYIPADPGGARRIVHHLSFALAALVPAIVAARSHRPEVVLCVVPSLLAVPVARLAAWLTGARLWLHVQDFEVEAAFATGLLPPRGFAARLARWLENHLLALADRVSTISPQMVARLIAKGIPSTRVREVRNWAAVSAAAENEGASYRRQWQLGAGKVALYSGNIANKQGIDVVIEAARRLRGREDIVFVLCGEGPNRSRLEAQAAGLGNVQFHDLQPAERLGDLLALASVHLLPQIAGAADLVLPSKLTNMLASGRPVVATAEPETGLYHEVDGCGLVVPPGNAQALANAVERLVDDPALAGQLGREARHRAAVRWSRQAIIARLESDLVGLAGSSDPIRPRPA